MENKFTDLCQIGFVVRDIEKLRTAMREIFGVEPDLDAHTILDDSSHYHNQPADFHAQELFYRFAGIELEFVAPMGGKSVWQDHLDKHGEGLHHVLFNVDNFEEAKEQLAKHDIPLVQQGTSVMKINGESAKWAYFDNPEKLPFIVEVKNTAEIIKKQKG